MTIKRTDNYTIIEADAGRGICRSDNRDLVVTSVAVPIGSDCDWVDCDLPNETATQADGVTN